MAVYTFGLDAAEVAAARFAAQTIDTASGSALDRALSEAAGAVNQLVQYASGADPSGITEAAYPVDWQTLRSLICDGAAFIYLRSATGAVPDDVRQLWMGGMGDLEKRPQTLRFVQTARSNAYVTTHTSTMSQTEIDAYRREIPTPERRGWGVS